MLTGIAVIMVAAILFARLLYGIPSLDGRTVSSAVEASETTRLGSSLLTMADDNPGKSGIRPLRDGADAFAARGLLARAAQQTIDAQYYIWQNDLTGFLLLQRLREAADRGVRVRLLLDDNGTPDLDAELSALDTHPNIEVRLFNPFILRDPRFLGYLFDFFRLNRRMHNKSFTVDNVAAIIGGRNVGDEYFGTGEDNLYIDLDVLTVGHVVPAVSASFDQYWSSGSSYPINSILFDFSGRIESFDATLARLAESPQLIAYRDVLTKSPLIDQLLEGTLPLEWVDVELIADNPAKGVGKVADDQLMISDLSELLVAAQSEVDIVSPYFVPGDRGVSEFGKLETRNVELRIFTNALETTDVLPVHAGYSKYRKELLAKGTELFELKSGPLSNNDRDRLGITGSSGSSLHAKTIAVDRRRVYVGSFNFDPRSVRFNTEMGFVIESPRLAAAISGRFDNQMPYETYQPVLTKNGSIIWNEKKENGTTRTYADEPGTTAFQRGVVTLIGWLPIEWLL